MKRIGQVVVIMAVVAMILILVLALPVLHSIFHDFSNIGKSQLFAQERRNESLPTVTIEHSNTVYCRMRECDFRFPLPLGAQVQRMDPPTGGFDTIRGVIYVTAAGGGPVDSSAYAALLRKHHFDVDPGFATAIKEGYVISLSASTEDGGWVAADVVSNCTKIVFSYFGDL